MSDADAVDPRPIPPASSAPSVAAVTVASATGVRASRVANLLNTIGHKATTALLPGFLVGTLAAAPTALGLIEGIAEGLGGVSRVPAASSRPNRAGVAVSPCSATRAPRSSPR
jgi:hypothetical protein